MDDLYPFHESVRIPTISNAAGVFQLDVEKVPNGLRRAAEAQCSTSKQLVLISTDLVQLDFTVNLVANLVSVGVPHYLVLSSTSPPCHALDGKLACVWSSLMDPFQRKLRLAQTNAVRAMWIIRQIYLGRLAAMGFSTMLLDADVAIFANPFAMVDQHLPRYAAFVLGDTSAGYMGINGGTIYLRHTAADGPILR